MMVVGEIDLTKGAGKLMVCDPQEADKTITVIKVQKESLKFPRKILHLCISRPRRYWRNPRDY
jgi:hypothetical protein